MLKISNSNSKIWVFNFKLTLDILWEAIFFPLLDGKKQGLMTISKAKPFYPFFLLSYFLFPTFHFSNFPIQLTLIEFKQMLKLV